MLTCARLLKQVGSNILGAGLDTFVQRRPEIASRLKVFEVDQPGTQDWKRRRLTELGFGVPDHLRLVPVNFEAGDSRRRVSHRHDLTSQSEAPPSSAISGEPGGAFKKGAPLPFIRGSDLPLPPPRRPDCRSPSSSTSHSYEPRCRACDRRVTRREARLCRYR